MNRYVCVLPSTVIHCRLSAESLRFMWPTCGLKLASFDVGCTGNTSSRFKHPSRVARSLHASRVTTWSFTSVLPYIFVDIICLSLTRRVGFFCYSILCLCIYTHLYVLTYVKGKAIPLQVWTGPEGSRRLRLPDFKTIGT